MRKFLLCSTVIALFGGVSATDNSLLPEVTNENSDLMANFPTDVPTLQAGTLKYDSHLYDLICTGNCNLVKKDNMPPDVLHMDKVPSFVEVCKEGTDVGQIVFTEPKPMGTVSLPSGHDAYVTISLQKIRSAFEQTNAGKEAVKYVALGVRVQGIKHYTSVLRVPLDADDANAAAKNVPSVCFHMGTGNVVELVPLLSATDMSGDDGYTVVEPGAVANRWAFLSGTNPTAFNFDSVFRANVECLETVSTLWEYQWGGEFAHSIHTFECINGAFFSGITGGSAYPFLLLAENQTKWITTNSPLYTWFVFHSKLLGKYVGITREGNICESDSGDQWEDATEIGAIPLDAGKEIRCMADLGEKVIVSTKDGYLYSLSKDAVTWIQLNENLTNLYNAASNSDVAHLRYGNEVLIATTENGWISIGDKTGGNWSSPIQLADVGGNVFGSIADIAFGNEEFWVVNPDGALLVSTDKGKNWHKNGEIDITNIGGLTYGYGAFYVMNIITETGGSKYTNVYRSQAKPIDLTK